MTLEEKLQIQEEINQREAQIHALQNTMQQDAFSTRGPAAIPQKRALIALLEAEIKERRRKLLQAQLDELETGSG